MRARAAARLLCAVISVVIIGANVATPASAAPGPGWEISSVARPTNFSSTENTSCPKGLRETCDRYLVTLTNVGASASDGSPIVIKDALPAQLHPAWLEGSNLEREFPHQSWNCRVTTTTCTYFGTVAAGGTLVFELGVEVEGAAVPRTALNKVTVTGGGAQPTATAPPLTLENPIDGPESPFGISAFGAAGHDIGGAVDAQAGSHPDSFTTTINLNTAFQEELSGRRISNAAVPPKDLVVDLPLGLVGNPNAAAQCTERQLTGNPRLITETECPAASRVGTIILFENNVASGTIAPEGGATAVYNMVPDKGYPAEFGFKTSGVPVDIYASVVHLPVGYALRVGTLGLPTTIDVEGAAITFFGDPRSADGEPGASHAFFTNPTDCSSGPLTARVEADSWADPGRWVHTEADSYPTVTGCDLLQFEPTVELLPEVTQAEEPSGEQIRITLPQRPETSPFLATPDLKNVTMTLPSGMTLSPGGADGLAGCTVAGSSGIDMPTDLPDGSFRTPTEIGEGEAIGPDGMSHLVAGHCPAASQIGTVKITTPVLAAPLEGHVYVAQPECGGAAQAACTPADAASGRLFGIYLEAEGSGVVIKLKGSVSVDPTTGQLTARFTENPQFPLSELTLDLEGGATAPLVNPRQCGDATTSADLTPWSSPMTPDAILQTAFPVSSDRKGAPCPASLPFDPSMAAGPRGTAAGQYSPLTFTISRGDHQQDLSRIQVHLAPGLLGMLSSVPLCGEPQAAQGNCSEASQVGTTSVAVGSGAHPLWEQGRAYLSGPYLGAPFGLSIVVPAVAGPFNLGNVVVRSRINIDPSTSAVIITSDALPQMLDGVPLRIQKLNVTVDRAGFTFNPTSCALEQINTDLESTQGASVEVSSPVAASGCRGLTFKPSFKVSTRGDALYNRHGASLDVQIGAGQGPSGAGEANIRKVEAQLPRQLAARLSTLQKACTEEQFAADPAGCPEGSLVGSAVAHTPVLPVPLSGPAYLVSHGGRAFPDLDIVLQGDGVTVVLTGHTQIKAGITYSRFETVPDAPISSFELNLPEGSHSVLAAAELCNVTRTVTTTKHVTRRVHGHLEHHTITTKKVLRAALRMPTTITAQNGATLSQDTAITVTGCPKPRHQPSKQASRAQHRPRSAT